MTKFLLRRIAFGMVVVALGAFISYAVIRMIPNAFVVSMARQLSQTPGAKPYHEWLAQLEATYGLDRNIFSGFILWAGNALRLNFGDSWRHTVPVLVKFREVIGFSVIIALFSLMAELLIGVPLGIAAARKQYSKVDYGVTVFALMGISLPSFFLASLLRYVFAVRLNWFELYGIVSRGHQTMDFWGRMGDYAWHMALPVVTLMMLSIGGVMRYTRTNMLEVLGADYIRTARAKGLSEGRVIFSHAFRNTLIPLVTFFSYLLPALFGGALITEQIFAIPGIGFTAYESITTGDIPFTMFYLVFIIAITQVSLIIADILYAVVDPRVRIN